MKKRLISLLVVMSMIAVFTACSSSDSSTTETTSSQVQETTTESETETSSEETSSESAEVVSYKVGICNYVDDASLNQIYENLESRLNEIADEENVNFEIYYDNCMADANVLNQIISDFIDADQVDILVGIATPVAMAMQSATEDTDIPVVFSAVSDPISTQLVDSMDAPGANITGTSDLLNTDAIMDLMFAADPEIENVALLYDVGQDSATSAIESAKAYLEAKGVSYKEYTGTTNDEVMLAADSIVLDGMDAIFTPTDNTIMTAELSIYQTFADAGIPHYTGADSFALNGAFVGYGVDYEQLGVETANMINDILVNGSDPATTPVITFDNGIASINTEICDALGYDLDTIKTAFEPYCTSIRELTTAEEFE